MATRLYYNDLRPYYVPSISYSTYGFPGPQTFTANYSAGIQILSLATTRPQVARSAQTAYKTTGTTQNFGLGLFLSPPLASGVTFSGTVKGQMLVYEASTSSDVCSQLTAYVVDGTTYAIKQTIYGGYSGALASEWTVTTPTNRQMPLGGAVSVSSVSAVTGDRILVGVGARGYQSSTGSAFAASGIYSSVVNSDLPEDQTSTTDAAPWVEFSTTLSFGADTALETPSVLEENITEQELMDLAEVEFVTLAWQDPDGSATVSVPTEGQIWPRGGRTGT